MGLHSYFPNSPDLKNVRIEIANGMEIVKNSESSDSTEIYWISRVCVLGRREKRERSVPDDSIDQEVLNKNLEKMLSKVPLNIKIL